MGLEPSTVSDVLRPSDVEFREQGSVDSLTKRKKTRFRSRQSKVPIILLEAFAALPWQERTRTEVHHQHSDDHENRKLPESPVVIVADLEENDLERDEERND